MGRRKESLDEFVVNYPKRKVDDGEWAPEVGAFVTEQMRRMGTDSRSYARDQAFILGRIAMWCVGQRIPLDVEVVLDRDTVEEFDAAELSKEKDGTRMSQRSILRKLSRHLAVKAPWEPGMERLPVQFQTSPYTPSEMTRLELDASTQSTMMRWRGFNTFLALSHGAGLMGDDLVKVRPEDVFKQATGFCVKAGDPPRIVPVLDSRCDLLMEVALACPKGDFLIGGDAAPKSRASKVAGDLELSARTPKPVAARFRSTWLLHHLTMGTPIADLMDAADVTSAGFINGLLPYVPRLHTAAARRALSDG